MIMSAVDGPYSDVSNSQAKIRNVGLKFEH